jgi:flavin-dependent dehydrogenase
MFSILTPDVCIVGGGPAGAALACTLSQSNYFDSNETGKRIMLLDSSPKLP